VPRTLLMSEAKQFRDEERLDLPSASKMARLVACPGSHALEQTLPPEAFQADSQQEEWAEKGTRIHRAKETGNTLELDEEEAEIYRQGVAYEEQIVQKWMRDKNLDDCEEGPREMRVWLHDPLNFPELLGSVQLDAHYYNKERGCVLSVDWKSGFDPNLPPSPSSWQLRFGAVALKREEYTDWMKECRVAHCKAQQKHTVNDYCDYAEADLEMSWQAMRLHLWESTQPDAQRHPGQHCTFCPCKPYCLEAGGYSLLPSVAAKEKDWELQVAQMQPKDLVRIWSVSTITEKIIEAVKDRLKAMPDEDLAAIGLERGKGRSLDPIVDVPGAYSALLKEFTEESVLKCMKLGKTELAKLAAESKGKSKEDAGKWVSSYLDKFIERKTSEAPLRRIKA